MAQKAYTTVDTDVGLADVYHQGPRAKTYKCPMCEYDIDGEWHVVLTPRSNRELRRHAHKECLERFLEQGLEVKLLPGSYSYG